MAHSSYRLPNSFFLFKTVDPMTINGVVLLKCQKMKLPPSSTQNETRSVTGFKKQILLTILGRPENAA